MEAKEEVLEVLPQKKKTALLLYLSILFAAAFLLVAISLFVKVRSAENANLGAQQNIVVLESQLENAKNTVVSQTKEIESLQTAKSELENQLTEASSDYEALDEEYRSSQVELAEVNAALSLKAEREQAIEALLNAQLAYSQDDEEAFRAAMELLAPLKDKLSENAKQIYEALLQELN